MNIKTLISIHSLLTEDRNTRYNAYKLLRDAVTKAEEDGAPNAKCLKEEADKAWSAYAEANDALCDFECHDWH